VTGPAGEANRFCDQPPPDAEAARLRFDLEEAQLGRLADRRTTNAEPITAPSRSAIQQRSRLASKLWMKRAAISATSASKRSSQPYSSA